jgi:hypothetical protein
MVDLQTISLIVQIVGVSATAIAAVVGVRSYINSNNRAEEARKKEQETRERELETRQAQLFMQIYSQFNSKEFVEAFNEVLYENPPVYKDYDDYRRKYIEKNPEYDRKVSQILTFMEGVGVLVNRGLLDLSYVDDLFSSMVIRFWESMRLFMLEYRVRANEPQNSEWVEYLYDRVKEVAEKQHPALKSGIKPLTSGTQ